MDERNYQGGYGNRPRSHQGNSDFGSDFISFASDNTPDASFNQRRGWRGRQYPQQLQRISGTQRSHNSIVEENTSNASGYSSSFRGGSNHRFPRPEGMRRGGPFRGGFGWRGNRNHNEQRHQGKFSTSSQDISSYYHPSMTEDPWENLENLLKLPSSSSTDSSSQFETTRTSDIAKTSNNSDSDPSQGSEDSD